MAKVGSLSVYFSLKKWTKRQSIFHIHSLSEKEVRDGIKLCFENNIYPGSKSPVFLINNKIIDKGKSYKIICLFRDPLERNISAFFDALEFYIENDFNKSFKDLEQLYFEKLHHNYPIDWFDNQFFEATNIDVYNYNFDREQGYKIINENNVGILLMNSSLDDSVKEELIVDFCNLTTFKLNNRNVGSTKEYANLYKDFKSRIRFSKEYLNQLYKSKYTQHFFSEQIIKRQLDKWSK